jgi:hypothetical protein
MGDRSVTVRRKARTLRVTPAARLRSQVWSFGKTVAQNVPSLKKFSTRAADG